MHSESLKLRSMGIVSGRRGGRGEDFNLCMGAEDDIMHPLCSYNIFCNARGPKMFWVGGVGGGANNSPFLTLVVWTGLLDWKIL